MNREIIFRGKRLYDGEWVEGYLFVSQGGGHYILDTNNDGDNGSQLRFILVEHETVGQFTGLTDKNGKKIFEGDIVINNMPLFISLIGIVRYGIYRVGVSRNIGFYADWSIGEMDSLHRMDLGWWCYEQEIKVIGNIYDNPELLKGETK